MRQIKQQTEGEKKTMKKIAYKFTAAVLAATLALTGCGSNKTTQNQATEETVTIRLGVVTNSITQFLSIVEKHAGIYQENGINLETTEFAMGINAVDSIVAGQVDITHIAEYAGVNRIGNTSDKTDLRFFTKFGQSDQFELYVDPEKVSDISDLEGQSVATITGSVYDYWYAKLFEYGGIDKSQVDLQSVTSAQEALALAESGSIVAYWATSKKQKDLFAEKGWTSLITNGEVNADCIQVLVATEGFLSSNQATMVKFLKATDETIQYIGENFDEVAGWINEDLGLDADTFKAALDYDFSFGFTEGTYEKIQQVNTWCRSNGNYTADFDIADFLNLDAVKEYDAKLVTYSK